MFNRSLQRHRTPVTQMAHCHGNIITRSLHEQYDRAVSGRPREHMAAMIVGEHQSDAMGILPPARHLPPLACGGHHAQSHTHGVPDKGRPPKHHDLIHNGVPSGSRPRRSSPHVPQSSLGAR